MKMQEMRRKDRQLDLCETWEVLERGEYAVLSTVNDQGQPYGVPMSYAIDGGVIYLHCAGEGQKLDNLRINPQASLTVVVDTEPVYDKGFSTYYASAVLCGRVVEVTGIDEKSQALYALAKKYLPEHLDKANENIDKLLTRTVVLRMDQELITGKAKKKIK